MKTFLLSCTIALLAVSGRAEELKLNDGTVLKDATVSRLEEKAVRINHADGVAAVPFDSLPPEWRARFASHYAQVEAQRKANEAAAARIAAENEKIRTTNEKLLAQQQKQEAISSGHTYRSHPAPPASGGDIIIVPNGFGTFTIRQLPRGVSYLQSVGGMAVGGK